MERYRELASEYSDHLRVRNYAAITIMGKKHTLDEFREYAKQLGGVRDIDEIDRELVERYLLHLRTTPSVWTGKPRDANYIRDKILHLRQFYHYLIQRNRVLVNPLTRIETPRPAQRLPRNVLTEAEMIRLLNAPDLSTDTGKRDRALLELAYSSGLRRRELVNLRVSDLDLSHGVVFVRQGKPRRDRVAPVGRPACQYLTLYLDEARPRLIYDSRIKSLFVSSCGKPLSYQGIYSPLQKQLQRARIRKRIGWHSLRHSCATHMLQHGADIRYIQELLGHVSLSSTVIYTKVYPGAMKTALAKARH